MNGVYPRSGYPPVYNQFPQLIRRNDTGNSTNTSGPESHPPSYKYVGLVLAIASGCFIGVSFVLKKLGLLKANVKYNEEAGEGYGYLKNAWWWGGMTLMIMGEICNFAAYLFADAILVTPLGALSVVITAILSGIFLKERLSFVGKIGCFNCIIGSIVIAANAPTQPSISTIQDMKKLVLAPGFLVFAGIIIIGCAVVALWVAPRYGKKSMMVYLTVCSLIGGLSVVCIQGIGAAITAQARGIPQFNQWFLYIVLVFVIVTLVTEIIYLNKALNLYNAALVTPTYYVYFTSATIISGAVLYQGFKGTALQILTVVLGFLQICSGVVLLQFSKSAKDVPDAAVFTSDLDQVRTVAEQEEPEYEPRADTMRGTAALIRAISTKRQKRETKEILRIKEEHLQPITENDGYEYDGIRRRRTLSSPGQTPVRRNTRTDRPPLGMSSFPTDDEEDPDNGMHPGFWSHFRRKPVSAASAPPDAPSSVPMNTFKNLPPPPEDDESTPGTPRVMTSGYGLPPSLRQVQPSGANYLDSDTSYHGAEDASGGAHHITWAASASAPNIGHAGATSPPGSPSAGRSRDSTKRQFSFHNVFRGGSRSPTQEVSPVRPPMPRSGLSFSRRTTSSHASGGGTEEERLGLVRGDSSQEGVAAARAGSDKSSDAGEESQGGTVLKKSKTKGDSSDDEPPQGASYKDFEGRGGEGGGTHGRSFI